MLLQHTLRISLIWHIEVTRINLGLQILRIATIDSATHSIASTKNLFDGAFEFFGTASTFAARFWMVSFTVTRMPFHALVFFTISSPIFLGDIPKGPTFGANTDDGACSPPH